MTKKEFIRKYRDRLELKEKFYCPHRPKFLQKKLDVRFRTLIDTLNDYFHDKEYFLIQPVKYNDKNYHYVDIVFDEFNILLQNEWESLNCVAGIRSDKCINLDKLKPTYEVSLLYDDMQIIDKIASIYDNIVNVC